MVDGMKETHAVRAAHDAIPAAYTPFPVDKDDAVVSLVCRTHRADLNAWRIFALIAKLWHKERLINIFILYILVPAFTKVYLRCNESVSRSFRGIGEGLTVFCDDISFHPRPRHVGVIRYLVFKFACLYAHAAADTFVSIDEEYPPRL